MPARPYWSGQIRLALVSIPVSVFSATRSAARIAFNQIHKPSGKRIRYEKVVPGIGAVDPEDIVKGYEVEKNQYVLLNDEEIDDIKLEAKHTLDLIQFVGADEIDPVFFEKPYYVAPEEKDEVAGEAYVVLRDALKETGTIGLGQLIIRGKSTVVALKPAGKGLVLETLRYADEINKADSYFEEVPAAKPDKELLGLAEELIERKRKPFEASAFKDPYEAALRELIDAKLEHRKPQQIEAPAATAKVINLMDALKKSISTAGAKAPAPARTSAKAKAAAKEKPAAKAKAKTTKGKRAA